MVLLLKDRTFFQLVELKVRIINNDNICFKDVTMLESLVISLLEIINYYFIDTDSKRF